MSWQEECAKRLKHSVQSEEQMIAKIENDIYMDKLIEEMSANEKYMYSEATYADELDNSFKPNYDENRSYEMCFYELVLKDGRVRYRSANSIDDLYSKYGKIFYSIRQIKQEDYILLREKASHLGQDDIS